ncbi:hypothetical protein Ddye_010018 [Dipteronia dyeriana]|uniref:RNase H type-1 domain-containing protein n=1 Tax=Dipteronia dyeriana TaxID=168575 RepID=A0AAE0CMW0_9ROSI|nr:hypothetical protein Ddye_010018 [Dipteronia dyeriana]
MSLLFMPFGTVESLSMFEESGRSFIMALQRTWYSRNSSLFKSKGFNVKSTLDWCKTFLRTYSCSNIKTSSCYGTLGILPAIWAPLVLGSFKINCLAISDFGNRRTGSGIVIRNHDGLVMSSCSLFLDNWLEFLAANSIVILKGLKFCKWCGLHTFCVEYDVANVVSMINNGSHLNSICGNIICDIISLMKDLGIPSISLGKKGLNKVAFNLTN